MSQENNAVVHNSINASGQA